MLSRLVIWVFRRQGYEQRVDRLIAQGERLQDELHATSDVLLAEVSRINVALGKLRRSFYA